MQEEEESCTKETQLLLCEYDHEEDCAFKMFVW